MYVCDIVQREETRELGTAYGCLTALPLLASAEALAGAGAP